MQNGPGGLSKRMYHDSPEAGPAGRFYGPEDQMDWMIWKNAEPITTNTNRACKNSTLRYIGISGSNYLCTYYELRTDGVVVVLLGGLAHVASLRDVFSVLLAGFSHLWCSRHGGRLIFSASENISNLIKRFYLRILALQLTIILDLCNSM